MVVENKGNSTYKGGVLLITIIYLTVEIIGSTFLSSDEQAKPAKTPFSLFPILIRVLITGKKYRTRCEVGNGSFLYVTQHNTFSTISNIKFQLGNGISSTTF